MKILDIILLLGILFQALVLLLNPKKLNNQAKLLYIFILIVLAIHLFQRGYFWQFIPSYLLFSLVTLKQFGTNTFRSGYSKYIYNSLLIGFIFFSILPFTILRTAPKLTPPKGPHKVGTQIFRWEDINRKENSTEDPNDFRNVIVQAWYPTDSQDNGNHSLYLDGLNQLPNKIGGVPSMIFDHFDQLDTHGLLNAPISEKQEKWPVIIFLTGNVSSRAFYTSIITGLASEGYVVLALDHPYEAMVSELENGQLVTTVEKRLENDPELLKLMESRLNLRVSDIRFVIDKIEQSSLLGTPLFGSFDLQRLGIAGHSLGGASAAVAMIMDPRIKAAANVDGTLYGELPETLQKKPFLLLESKKDNNGQYQRYENGNKQLFEYFGGGYRFEIHQADHFSFSDFPLFFALPTRVLLGKFLEFGNYTPETHRLTIIVLSTFFNINLNNKPVDLILTLDQSGELLNKSPN
jgi:predicted dienelactone hydrolase